MRRLALPLGAALLASSPALARTLAVGAGKDYPAPSAAIRAAQDGDTVLIEPGEYFDCAIVERNRLTIAGSAPGAVMTDKACQGKALLVIGGNDVTVRDLTLTRARVPDGNGGGIRLEGENLSIQRVSFVNDQVGLLSGGTGGEIRIEDCRFERGGVGGERPLFAVFVNAPTLLRVERSTFKDVKGGQITSGADRTELVGNTIAVGTGDGPGEAALLFRGDVRVEDNSFIVGPNPPRRNVAVAIWEDAKATLRRNRLVNYSGQPVALVLDWSRSTPVLENNQIGAEDQLVTSAGLLRHKVWAKYQAAKPLAKDLVRPAYYAVLPVYQFIKDHLRWH